jgi:hypothetical protein
VAGIPDTFHINIDNLPKIQLGLDPVTLNPVTLNLAVTEIPNIRGHLPADFCVGISILGLELFSIRLCGEAQIITEPYQPNPCERCGPVNLNPGTAIHPSDVSSLAPPPGANRETG